MSATLETASSLMNSSCQVVDADWPEAWYMVKDEEVKNQKMENRLTPNKKVSVEEMKNLGLQVRILYMMCVLCCCVVL